MVQKATQINLGTGINDLAAVRNVAAMINDKQTHMAILGEFLAPENMQPTGHQVRISMSIDDAMALLVSLQELQRKFQLPLPSGQVVDVEVPAKKDMN